MKIRTALILAGAAFLFFVCAEMIFSQEQPAQEAISAEQAAPAPLEMQWVWGEAVSVDAKNNTVVVRYLDYESDQEKELTVAVDDKTTYDNFKSVSEIQPKDTLSIDYVIMPDGGNLAKDIGLEKIEGEEMAQPADVSQSDITMPGSEDAEAVVEEVQVE